MVSRLVERLSDTRTFLPEWRAAFVRFSMHFGIYCLLLAACFRPLFALTLFVAMRAGLRVADRAKRRVIRESIVFSDLALLGQIVRHPGLYVIHLRGRLLAWVAVVLSLVAASLLFALERPIGGGVALAALVAGVAALLATCWLALPLTHSPHFLQEPDFGSRRFGLPAALLVQWMGWLRQPKFDGELVATDQVPDDCDIIILQLESFADVPGRGYPAEPLSNWSRLCKEAAAHGRLRVEVTGANTLRTEFSVLTGLGGGQIGFDRFNPYLRAGRYGGHAWPARFAHLGMRTIFIHPHDGRFYARARVMPQLGFSDFRDIEQFQGAERSGPYVSDAALADEILRCLEAGTSPAFVFAVTMECHGPWTSGRLGDGVTPADGYLNHLRNADAAIARLVEGLRQRGRRALLVAYGDHLPDIDAIRDRVATMDTDFLVLDTGVTAPAVAAASLSPAALMQVAIGIATRRHKGEP